MKKIWFIGSNLLLVAVVSAQMEYRSISGVVSDGNGPLEEVVVANMDSNVEVRTDKRGRYEIDALKGERLAYNYNGKKTIEIDVEDVTQFLNVELKNEVQELSEVVITKKRTKSQLELSREYNGNPDLIRTSYGIIDTKKSNYNIRVFQGKDLNPASFDVVSILRAKVPGILISNRINDINNVRAYFQRGYTSINNPTPILFDVDGTLMHTVPMYVDAINIDRIAIISSIGALTRYGSLGAGGLVVINTKVSNFVTEPGSNAPFDQAKQRTNFFKDGEALPELVDIAPAYMKDLRSSESMEEALQVYQELSRRNSPSPYFYLDSRTFFLKERPNPEMVELITEKVVQKFSKNPVVLKALAYQMDEIGAFDESLEIYKKVFILRPDYQQSYRDLANAYLNFGNARRAALLYARYNYLLSQDLFQESETFTAILKRDFDNLLARNKDLIPKNMVKNIKDKEGFNGTRLFFEWNDSEAEFDLQFVNNKKQFYIFKHNLFDNENLIKEEKKYGFSSQEHLIYDHEGAWKVNVKYTGNKSLTPTYLKVTVYKNFGLPSEQKEFKVFKLSAKNVNQELATFVGS